MWNSIVANIPTYNHHKTYYLNNHSGAQEKLFFKELFNLVHRNKTLEIQRNPTNMGAREKSRWEKRIVKYESFLKMMKSKDDWEISSDISEGLRSIHKNLKSKRDNLDFLTNENKRLEEELATIKYEYEKLKEKYRSVVVSPTKKISIKKEHFGTFINLLSELKEVEEPKQSDNNKFQKRIFETKSINTWVKLITNNFTEEGKEIETSRVENYIVKGRRVPRNSYQCKIEISSKKVI